ncbi:MAG: hypothetical protein MUO50_06035 [Longimicrobiales bacterium]|nr:hypothetical protein [Longimicrobiales bacterium]
MADDHVIDIRRFLGEIPNQQDEAAFAVWGNGGERSRFALPLWRAIYLLGGNWGGIVSLSKLEPEDAAHPLYILDLKEDPARTFISTNSLGLLQGDQAPALVFTDEREVAVLLGEDEDRQWFLQVRGGASGGVPEGRARETLLFLAGECAGLLFFRELATPLPSSASTP